jgi:hypothetical protein
LLRPFLSQIKADFMMFNIAGTLEWMDALLMTFPCAPMRLWWVFLLRCGTMQTPTHRLEPLQVCRSLCFDIAFD